MIREKSEQERLAMQFASAGLGARSAVEAARMVLESGLSFESAAVLGQRMGEECSATPAKILEAARRHRRLREGAPTRSAWGRPLEEAAPAAAGGVKNVTQIVHKDKTVVIGGVLHQEVVEYQPVADQPSAREGSTSRTAWGRKVEG